MADQKPVTLNCPSCGAPLEFDGRSSIVRCRFCKNNTLVPGLPAANEATPRASLDEVRQLAQNGNLEGAIRRYRELYDTGMKEARDAVQALANGKVVEIHRVFSGPLNAEETSRVMEEVKVMLEAGNKSGALTHYREVNDVSLTQARYVIDQIEAALTGVPAPTRPMILGQPSVSPKRAGARTAIIVTFAILILTGGIVAFALTGMGGLFTPRLYASGPAALIASEAENALYLVYDTYYGCIQRLDFTSGQVTWQTSMEQNFSFPPYGFQGLLTESKIIFSNSNQLVTVNKSNGEAGILMENDDYEFLPMGMAGDTLVVRARRTRGTERFEIWGLNPSTGVTLWQIDLQGAAPIDPPDEMAGLVDDTDPGFTWRLTPAGLILVKFQANPSQLVLDTINPVNGLLVNEQVTPLKNVSNEDYSIPKVIGWQDQVVYLNVDSNILALDISTGEVLFIY